MGSLRQCQDRGGITAIEQAERTGWGTELERLLRLFGVKTGWGPTRQLAHQAKALMTRVKSSRPTAWKEIQVPGISLTSTCMLWQTCMCAPPKKNRWKRKGWTRKVENMETLLKTWESFLVHWVRRAPFRQTGFCSGSDWEHWIAICDPWQFMASAKSLVHNSEKKKRLEHARTNNRYWENGASLTKGSKEDNLGSQKWGDGALFRGVGGFLKDRPQTSF